MSHNVLQVIAHYDMTPDEALAYRVACMFEHLVEKVFPKMRQCTLGKGDPRKKEVFKYAWKLIHDPDKPLQPADYKLYVFAQLKVFKAYLDQGKEVFIHPNCLTSDKAWNRWLLFKSKFEQRQKFQTPEQAGIQVNTDDKIAKELTATKAHFLQRFHRLAAQDVLDALNSRTMLRWVAMRHVSGYYPHLSPIVDKWLQEKGLTVCGYFGYALNVYGRGMTPEARETFRKEFPHEYEAKS